MWIFGFFTAILGGGGEYEILLDGSRRMTEEATSFPFISKLIDLGVFSSSFFIDLGKLILVDPFTFFVSLFILVLFLSIFVFLLWITITSQAALFDSISRLHDRKKISMRKEFYVGMKYFGPVLGLNIIAKVIASIVLMVIGLPLYYFVFQTDSPGWILFIYLLAFLVFLPAVIIIYFVTKYAIAYVVIGKKRFLESLDFGWKLFAKNWLVSLEMAAILLIINIAVILGLIIVSIPILTPFTLLAYLMIIFNSGLGFLFMMIFGMFIALTIISVVGAWFSTFQISSWILLYMRLVKEGGVSKIIRVFSVLPSKVIK